MYGTLCRPIIAGSIAGSIGFDPRVRYHHRTWPCDRQIRSYWNNARTPVNRVQIQLMVGSLAAEPHTTGGTRAAELKQAPQVGPSDIRAPADMDLDRSELHVVAFTAGVWTGNVRRAHRRSTPVRVPPPPGWSGAWLLLRSGGFWWIADATLCRPIPGKAGGRRVNRQDEIEGLIEVLPGFDGASHARFERPTDMHRQQGEGLSTGINPRQRCSTIPCSSQILGPAPVIGGSRTSKCHSHCTSH